MSGTCNRWRWPRRLAKSTPQSTTESGLGAYKLAVAISATVDTRLLVRPSIRPLVLSNSINKSETFRGREYSFAERTALRCSPIALQVEKRQNIVRRLFRPLYSGQCAVCQNLDDGQASFALQTAVFAMATHNWFTCFSCRS